MEMQNRICPRGAGYYIWRSGDTLASVARSNSTTVQAIRLNNPGVDFAAITPGTEVCMPSQSLTCQSGQPYTVQQGETLATIAQKLGMTQLALSERNPDVTNLTAGDVICIPAETNPSDTVQDGSAADDNTVTPAPGLSCPVGYSAQHVRLGQTYADLLVDLNVSYKAMRSANPTLRPGGLVAGTPYCAPPAGIRESCTRSYAVQEGDTLASIARQLNTTPGRLLMMNPTLLPTDFSQPGMMICIP